MDLQSGQKYSSAKCAVQCALVIAGKGKLIHEKELAERCVRGVSDGEVVALGNDKMRIKLSPFSFQREGTILVQGC